jgi:hypothetical protein
MTKAQLADCFPLMNRGLTDAVDGNAARRLRRRRPNQVRTVPPGLLLVGVGGATDPSLTAAELIALARAARGDAENPSGQP